MRWPQIELSLIVNGYDDGLSTGHLRDLVPNMLGPSDFRKNLSRLIDLHSSEQYALQRLLEYRFPTTFSDTDIKAFQDYIESPKANAWLPAPLDFMLRELRPETRKAVLEHLRTLFTYQKEHNQTLDYMDCSFGNLVFAGAYLKSNSKFNESVDNLANLFRTSVRLINATQGENRVLVAIKEDGQVLARESEIVGKQSTSHIRDIFLLEKGLTSEALEKINGMTLDEREAFLRSLDMPVCISPEADSELRNADIIIYGPGTQFSSLLPSYRTIGLPQALQDSKAALKLFVCNIGEDHDIQGLTCTDIVDKALYMMQDVDNSKRLITHVFSNIPPAAGENGDVAKKTSYIPLGESSPDFYKNATIIRDKFESAANASTHSGSAVIRKVMDLYENASKRNKLRTLEIYVDLLHRSRAVEQLLEEFLDLPWSDQFEKVQMRLNQQYDSELKLPDFASVVTDNHRGLFTEVSALLNWLAHSESDYLVTITGDGEYRLRDIFVGVQILKMSSFGAIYGSRTQSRHQFRSSLDSAYGEHSLLRSVSFLGAFVFTAVLGLKFRVIYSDPFTGFRIYRRSKMSEEFIEELRKSGPSAAATVTRLLLRHKIEIAEMPVSYRTFSGFTEPGWRLKRGVRNLIGLMF